MKAAFLVRKAAFSQSVGQTTLQLNVDAVVQSAAPRRSQSPDLPGDTMVTGIVTVTSTPVAAVIAMAVYVAVTSQMLAHPAVPFPADFGRQTITHDSF